MMKTNQDLRDRLQELHALTAQTPLFNPVFQLSLDISRELEGGVIDPDGHVISFFQYFADDDEWRAIKAKLSH